MSNSSTSKSGNNEGKWLLGYDAKRTDRLRKLQEFRDDCEKHHQRYAGTEIGPYLKNRVMVTLPTVNQPTMPVQGDFQLAERGGNDVPAFTKQMDIYERDKNIWMNSCKNVSSFQHECNKTYLPKLFVWIQERLESGLRMRVESHADWAAVESASPRSPLALMALIEEVMSKSDTSGEGYNKYEALKDLFSPGMAMKPGQSLTDFEKFVKGRMRFIQAKDEWKRTIPAADGAPARTESIFDEEFFVNLMTDNLSKVFDPVKIDYNNAIANSSIGRMTTFDDIVQYLSEVRSQTGQHVAATALAAKPKKARGAKKGDKSSTNNTEKTDKTKSTDGKKLQADGSNDPRRKRDCSHCGGNHWDNRCTKSKGESGAKNSSAPSSEEVKTAMKETVKPKLAADTLVTFGDIKMGDLTFDEIQEYCAFVSNQSEGI